MKNFNFNPYDVFGVPETKGKLKVERETCPKSEYLECSDELMDLAKKVLDKEGIEEAEKLSNMLVGTKRNKESAIKKLKELVAPPPKRPLYYCQHHIQGLPHWTRDPMRYLGDYIDVLVKEMSFEPNLRKILGFN